MVAFPGSVVRLEDCRGAAVAQFPERPHCHVSLSQRTLTAIDQRGQAPDSITAETCGGTVTSRARVKPDDAFQYEQGDGNRKNACQGPQYPTLPLQGVHDADNRPRQFPGQASLNGRSCDLGTEDLLLVQWPAVAHRHQPNGRDAHLLVIGLHRVAQLPDGR